MGVTSQCIPFRNLYAGPRRYDTAYLADVVSCLIARLPGPARPDYGIHSRSTALPQRGHCDRQVGGFFRHRRFALSAQTADSRHAHQGDVPDTEGSGAWRSRDVDSSVMDATAIPLCDAGSRRPTQTAVHWRALFKTGYSRPPAGQRDPRPGTTMDQQIPGCGQPEPTPPALA